MPTRTELWLSFVPVWPKTLSQHSVKQALLASLALNCTIPPKSSFDRKHYFYHDQPLGYQITQHYHPLAKSGFVEFPLPLPPPSSSSSKSSSSSSSSTRKIKRVRINQIQLEQDTAKTTTLAGLEGEGGMDEVLIDLNRAGTGLIEIVTEPDMRGAEEAVEFVKTLRGILRRTGVSDGDMEKGSLRVDCNVSVHRPGEEWGTRTEIKNVNSTRHVALAIGASCPSFRF
jgi:aspartyl-tRNA(Asn)/glutamyl-tRNA(Gln) amidotransferase subunit B